MAPGDSAPETEVFDQGAFPIRVRGLTFENPDDLLANPHNWRVHPRFQREVMDQLLRKQGWVGVCIQNDLTGHLVDGHMRVEVAAREQAQSGQACPVPVLHVELESDMELEALGTYDTIGKQAVMDGEKFKELVQTITNPSEGARSLMADALRHFEEHRTKLGDEALKPEELHARGAKDPNRAKVDLIFSAGGKTKRELGVCCLAVACGWSYGFQSGGQPCAAAKTGLHKAMFIDNEFKAYDHAKHLDCVAEFQPKYATVRDIMTREQCAELGIEYFSLEQILKWAEELAKHAENVMLIPKFDCLHEIPPEWMMGYSVPSSYGRTPLPIQAFKGRRVHLLGGSPKRQITYWQALQGDVVSMDQGIRSDEPIDPEMPIREGVVSLDTNYLLKIAEYGQFWGPDGKTYTLDDLGHGRLTNPLYPALSLSLGYFAAYFGRATVAPTAIQIEETER